MFNFGKKKPAQHGQPVTVHLLDAHKRAEPLPFTLHSTELMGLLVEAVQLGKLIATEERDLEAIRADYRLKSEYLEKQHTQIISEIEHFYGERKLIIDKINEQADRLTAAGQFEMAQALLNKLIDMVANHSPLRTTMELRNVKLLT